MEMSACINILLQLHALFRYFIVLCFEKAVVYLLLITIKSHDIMF